ncbi:MAG: acyl-CoA thioesterase [Burkholderiaceae bacterium]
MTTPNPGTPHPFDEAMAFTPCDAPAGWPGHATTRYWQGRTHPGYANMVGPFGGITAAQALNAVMLHPERLGEPLALTVNYAGPLADGPFIAAATPLRTNRSTQHWSVALLQTDASGALAVTTTATAVTAARRETWSVSDTPAPTVPRPHEVLAEARGGVPMEWRQRYEMRAIVGDFPRVWDDSHGHSSLTQLWMRDAPPRPLDFCALASLCDLFFPRLFLRRARRVPIGTVSMTVYFHAGSTELAATGTGYLLGQAQAQEFRNGFFDQTGQVWNEAGTMLATTHQVVYYKE